MIIDIEWKYIEGFDNNYKISNIGDIFSCRYNRYLKISTDKNGYKKANIAINGKYNTLYIHRLVAQAFIPNPENKTEINHKDEDKSNNNIENLEWVTRKENCNSGTRNKRISKANLCENSAMYGKKHTEISKQKMRNNHADFGGKNHPNYVKRTNEMYEDYKSGIKMNDFMTKYNVGSKIWYSIKKELS